MAPYHVIQRDRKQGNDLLYVILNGVCKEKNSELKANLASLFRELHETQRDGVNGMTIQFWLTSDWKMVAALLGHSMRLLIVSQMNIDRRLPT
jgi:hypothetical protein